MLGSLYRFLFPSQSLSIESDCSREQAIERLKAVTISRAAFMEIPKQLTGSVGPQYVQLKITKPYRNDFSPIFSGQWEDQDGRAVLTGTIALYWPVRWLFGLWIGGMLATAAWQIVVGLLNQNSHWPITSTLPLLLAGFALVAMLLGRSLAQGDDEALTQKLRSLLKQSS